MSKRIFRHPLLIAATSLMFANTYAVAPGFYMGLMTGPATNNGGEQQAQVQGSATTTTATPKSTQIGSRIFMGYKVNQYAGVEGGLTYFSGINYDTKGVQTCSGTNVRVRDFDILGKGDIPIGSSGFNAFGKAGAAIVYQSTSGSLNPDLTTDCGKTTYTNSIKPTFSIGVSYDLSQSWVADLSWNRLMTSGPISSVDLFALGISYHFVDVYCGQFLCG